MCDVVTEQFLVRPDSQLLLCLIAQKTINVMVMVKVTVLSAGLDS